MKKKTQKSSRNLSRRERLRQKNRKIFRNFVRQICKFSKESFPIADGVFLKPCKC
jgi:malate/lactate dehydrogenase